jgi:hypothetical protein
VNQEKTKQITDFVNGPATFPSFEDLLARTIEFNPTRTVESLRRGILHNALQEDDGSWVWRYRRADAPPLPEMKAAVEDGDKRPLQAFARYLAVQSPPINPEQIVTRMRFDTKAESPKLFFQPMRWLTDDEYTSVKQQSTSADAARAIVMTVAAADGVSKSAPLALAGKSPAVQSQDEDSGEEEAAPAPKPKAKKPKVEVAEDDGAEPEVRKEAAKPSAVPEKKGKLADIVADWDDE